MSNFRQEMSRRLKTARKDSRRERRARERHPEKIVYVAISGVGKQLNELRQGVGAYTLFHKIGDTDKGKKGYSE